MAVRCFILDFDGTFTDVEREAGPFLEGYRADLARIFGRDLAEAWQRAEAQIARAPHRYGWTFDGHVVAPGNSDPYVRATVTTNILLDQRELMQDADERTNLLQELYARNYRKAEAVFRPEAKDVLEAILATGHPVFVVSNSATDAVEAKIDRLHPSGMEHLQVRGNAKKYVVTEPESIDSRFDALPTSVTIDGLDRPIHLRRGHYYEVLSEVWQQTDTGPETTFIVGDIYELDLAMPARLGTRVHLLTRETTPSYERNVVEQVHGGTTSTRLDAVLDQL